MFVRRSGHHIRARARFRRTIGVQWCTTALVTPERSDDSLVERKHGVGDVRRAHEGARSERITLNVDVAEALDLLDRVPRACVAFAGEDGPHLEPVEMLYEGDRYLVGMHSSTARHPAVDEEVVLIVDDGIQFFDLRAVYVRGHARSPAGAEGLGGDGLWFEILPRRVVAWDYARIRQVDDET